MGAIAGLYYPATPKPVDAARIVAMTDMLAHRGPDAAGVWTAPGVGLGHRRLTIVDAAGGGQPMATPDLGLVAILDGEIYNFREVRAALIEKGARFQTDSDTEVLLHGWRVWGPGMLDRLDGMFALAVYDAEKRSLFLARDRFGVKPLLYTVMSDGAVAFASELKGLRAHPMFRSGADFRAVEDYMALGYIPDDASILTNVKKLPAGHFLLLERRKPVPSPQKWWSLDFARRAAGKPADLEAELIAQMREAVRAQMAANVPLGAFLNGDVDSAAVVALMAEASKKAVRTAGQADADDSDPAEGIAARFATRQRVRRTVDDFDSIDAIVDAFDEPFGDPAAVADYHAARFAREDMRIALSGDGADAAFAGYPRYRSHVSAEKIRGLLPEDARTRIFGTLGRLYPDGQRVPQRLRAKAGLLALARGGEFAYPDATATIAPALRQSLYSPAALRSLDGYRAERRISDTMRQAPARDALDRAQYADFQHFLPGNLLTRIDRTGMAAGLETRLPWLDHRLVQFAASLPPRLRIRAGQGKWLMRKALGPYLPNELLHGNDARPTAPLASWFRGPLAEDAAAIARSKTLAATGWFDLKMIARLAADHQAGRADHGRMLWQLMMLDKSLRRLLG